jgi:hypothetical protein
MILLVAVAGMVVNVVVQRRRAMAERPATLPAPVGAPVNA